MQRKKIFHPFFKNVSPEFGGRKKTHAVSGPLDVHQNVGSQASQRMSNVITPEDIEYAYELDKKLSNRWLRDNKPEDDIEEDDNLNTSESCLREYIRIILGVI
jgi:hypothetical protein